MRMRKDQMEMSDREVEANTDATNVVMHKDSVWNQQWETFKNSKVGESKKSISKNVILLSYFFIR